MVDESNPQVRAACGWVVCGGEVGRGAVYVCLVGLGSFTEGRGMEGAAATHVFPFFLFNWGPFF